VFSEMAVSMVRAGGEGGFLEDALERVSQFTELQEDLKSRTIGALIYPVILASVGTAVVTVLIVFFVPMFATLFDQLRQRNQLPVATDMLLAFSAFMRSWGWLAAVAIGVGAVAARYHLATERGRRLADLAKLRAPLGGVIFRSLAVARFCRVLGTLLRNGVPILKSLDISRSATGNRILSDAIAEASENISAGQSLAAPLAASGHFPTAVVEMIAVAEESNTLDQVLIQIADDLERRTTRRLDLLVRMIEPVLLVILAMVVLFVVIALLLPVVRMGGMVG
jgi:general secretion pathway protein F/type IV pilus assembly protein PilC